MSARKLYILCGFYCLIILVATNEQKSTFENPNNTDKYDDPEQFQIFHRGIRTADGESSPSYKPGFKIRELNNAQFAAARKRYAARAQNNGVLEWKERGPANVPGRTRGLIVDPDDATKNTWFAGSASGGVWKTINGGQLWTNMTPDLSNLATTVLAMAESNHDIIYLGTGEGFGNVDGISGSGIFKSINRGVSWVLLPSTIGFEEINRIIIDPTNANVVVAAANSGIYRTINGGTNWTQVFSGLDVQDVRSTPGNFSIQYAAQKKIGVLKSVDGGITWSLANVGMSPSGRVEIAVSPVNTSRVFASAEGTQSGSKSDLFISTDGANTWSLINVSIGGTTFDFLGGQGWFDNTLACDPFNADIVYIGGTSLFRIILGTGSTTQSTFTLQNIGASFLDLVTAISFNQGNYHATALATVSIEIRFGAGKSQFAHRFEVPDGSTFGVPDASYTYKDYITVPFEVWDITNNQQLMVSFRDQDKNQKFNLKLSNIDGAALDQSREYLYVHNIVYSTTASSSITVNGGQVVNMMYNFWPVLAAGSTWNPEVTPLPTSQLKVLKTDIQKKNATTVTVADVYNNFDGKNRFTTFGVDVHPDQHNIAMIPVDIVSKTYKILVANDGGLFISNTSTQPGINQGNWTMVGKTYNTSQFYGADKRPGKDEYFGGMQDNGTWKSPANQQATSTTNYNFSLGGDGFEVLWHPLDDKKLIGGSQENNFKKSIDGGTTWTPATANLSGTHPFISKLTHSKNNPDVIFTASSAGIFKSTNFGTSWTLTPITGKWGSSSFLDVEVSRANATIVWGGSGMSADRNLHVSTNGGATFTIANNYTDVTLGRITKLASHPFEDSTAYALFSFAGKPKILRTKNLGQTWEDISGFGNSNVSATGFPDVAVYCLYVRTDNPNIIWAGTEIGIVESLDNGASWTLLADFPNVAVWDMKGQDNQVVIATHGRGIWTATLNEPQLVVKDPVIIANGTSPKGKLKLRINYEQLFDSIQILSGTTLVSTIKNISGTEVVSTINNISVGKRTIKMISYRGNAPFHSKTYEIDQLDVQSIKESHASYFTTTTDLFLNGLSKQTISGGSSAERKSLHTNHSYTNNFEYILEVLHPITVSNQLPVVHYSDIAIVEPGQVGFSFGTPEFNDYVVVEGSKDGLDWVPLQDGYDARHNASWLNAFNTSPVGTKNMFVPHEVNLLQKFSVGDTVLIRFRLSANATINSWGWAIDYVAIQQQPTGLSDETISRTGITVFPNPAINNVTIEFELTRASDVSYEVIDLFGRSLGTKQLGQKQPGIYQEKINMISQSVGSYLVIVRTSEGKKVARLSVSR